MPGVEVDDELGSVDPNLKGVEEGFDSELASLFVDPKLKSDLGADDSVLEGVDEG